MRQCGIADGGIASNLWLRYSLHGIISRKISTEDPRAASCAGLHAVVMRNAVLGSCTWVCDSFLSRLVAPGSELAMCNLIKSVYAHSVIARTEGGAGA